MNETWGVLYGVALLFLFVLAVLWFCLPFAVFGTKPKLEELRLELRQTNNLLAELMADRPNENTHHRCSACKEPVRKGATICRYCGSTLNTTTP